MFYDDGPASDASRNHGGRGSRPPGDGRPVVRRPHLPRRQRPTPPECPDSKRGEELEKIVPVLEIELETGAS